MRHARGRKLESGVQKNRSIKPKIRWKAKGLPDVWQGQHQVLAVQQALIGKFYRSRGAAAIVMAPLCLVSEGFAGMAARPMNLGSINILLFLQESAIIYRT